MLKYCERKTLFYGKKVAQANSKNGLAVKVWRRDVSASSWLNTSRPIWPYLWALHGLLVRYISAGWTARIYYQPNMYRLHNVAVACVLIIKVCYVHTQAYIHFYTTSMLAVSRGTYWLHCSVMIKQRSFFDRKLETTTLVSDIWIRGAKNQRLKRENPRRICALKPPKRSN
jgi:hypothetical protein